MANIYLTPEGYDRIRKELEYLKTKKRRELSGDIANARAHGDISENAEYEAAKEAQGLNEKKIAELEEKLSQAQIIDESKMAADQALIGATVHLKDMDANEDESYTLVSEAEADFAKNRISVTSPVGKALLGHKAGDTVRIDVPAGTLNYKIIKISRLLILLALISAFITAQIPLSYAEDSSPSAKAVITGLAGEKDADILSHGTSGWVGAREDMALTEGDRIRTGADSKIRLELANGAIIDLAKESDVTLVQLCNIDGHENNKSILSIKTGYMHAIFNQAGPDKPYGFEVTTPLLECKASKAEIYVDAFLSTVYVTDGTASVMNLSTAETYALTAGNSITVNIDTSITGPQPYSDASVESIKNTFEVLQ